MPPEVCKPMNRLTPQRAVAIAMAIAAAAAGCVGPADGGGPAPLPPAPTPIAAGDQPLKGNPPVTENEPTKTVVVIETSMGTIKAELWADKAPVTVKNFLTYVDEGFFDGLIFHRVIKGFMIQGGGFDADMKQKATRDPITNEAATGTPNSRGTLAMARTNVVDSATAQFFINLVDNDFLNHRNQTPQGFGYCAFGEVTDGMDVVDKIGAAATGRVGHFDDVPLQAVTITSIRREQ